MTSIRHLGLALVAATLVATSTSGLVPASAESAAVPAVDPNASVAYQHDPAHDGGSSDSSFVAPLTKRWSATLAGTVGYPVIADGRVFVAVAHSSGYGVDVEALSLATGQVLWGPTSIGGTYWSGSLAYDAGQVFAINFDGALSAFDAATGVVNWKKQLAGQYAFTSPPTAVNGTVYVGGAGSGGTLYAVDEATGSTRWTAGVANGDHSSPAVDASGVYVSYACEQTYKFDLSGSLLWHHATDCSGGGGRTPVLHGGQVYVRDDAGKAPAILDASSGAQSSTFVAGPAPAFDADHRATVAQGALTVSDARTGTPLWQTTQGQNVTAPLVVNGYVIEGLSDGTIEVRRLQDGQLAWSGQVPAGLAAPDEHNATILTGLAQGDGVLVVPAGSTLTVFEPAGDPTVTVTSGPAPGAFTSTSVTFGFTSGVRNPSYQCSLDGQSKPCSSPVTYTGLAAGSHTFTVSIASATSGAAQRTFQVDAAAPVARMNPVPLVTVASSITVGWSATDEGSGVARYQLRTQVARIGAPLPAWSELPVTTATSAKLSMSRHTRRCVSVRAQDQVGNWSAWTASQCVSRA